MTAAITLRRAPDREPPFDDELPARSLHVVGPWDQPLPFDDVPARRGTDRAAGATGAAEPSGLAARASRRSATVRTGSADRVGSAESASGAASMPAEQWGRRFLVALLECAAGRRSLTQLSGHAALPVIEGFRNDSSAWARLAPNRRPGVVRTVRASHPSESSAEFSAVVQIGPRFRAVAARLERTADGWRCTRLQIG